MSMLPPALEMRHIEKSFARIKVLNKVDFTLQRGEIHALMGGNGAGKSTLMKILAGIYSKDAGSIRVNGKNIEIKDANAAKTAGIAMIFQEFSLVPTLTIGQNIFLNNESTVSIFIKDREANGRARRIFDELAVPLDPRMLVGDLSVGQMQMVEIAKAIARNAHILVMDEPTASLSESETEALFALVERLKGFGISIIYISHRMAEIFRLCDRVTVMRDGIIQLTASCAEISMGALMENMFGLAQAGDFQWAYHRHSSYGVPVVCVRNLALPPHVVDVSFTIQAGEIVGLAGLMGSGRTQIAEAIFGMRRLGGGEIRINDRRITSQSEALAAGVALVPEDRRRLGLIMDHSVGQNLILPNLRLFARGNVINERAADSIVDGMIRHLGIKTSSAKQQVALLSGGNQQKIVLGKWLIQKPRLLILDEPTIGVDIAAKAEIAHIIRNMAEAGVGVLVISSELEELLALSDRLLVLYNGRIFLDIKRQDIESEEVLHHAIQGHTIQAAHDTVHA